MIRNLLTDAEITKLADATAAGTTAVNSTGVDMQGYEGVVFLVSAGVIVAGGVQSINAAQGDTLGGTYDDLAGSKVTIADDDDDQLFAVEIVRPVDRFVRLEIARATQNSAFGPIYAFRYGASKKPVSNNVTDAITSEIHASPAEGTA